jgi:hypothetical protein
MCRKKLLLHTNYSTTIKSQIEPTGLCPKQKKAYHLFYSAIRPNFYFRRSWKQLPQRHLFLYCDYWLRGRVNNFYSF